MTHSTQKTVATDVHGEFLADISLWNAVGNQKAVNKLKVLVNQHHTDLSTKRYPVVKPILLIGHEDSGRTVLAHSYSNSLGCDQCFTASSSSLALGGRDIVDFLKQGTEFSSFYFSHAEKLSPYCNNIISAVLKDRLLRTREIPGYREASILPFYKLMIFATTDITQVDPGLLKTVDLHLYLEPYSYSEICEILKQRIKYLHWPVENENLLKNIAEISCETVSIAINVLGWTYRCARANGEDVITAEHVNEALHLME